MLQANIRNRKSFLVLRNLKSTKLVGGHPAISARRIRAARLSADTSAPSTQQAISVSLDATSTTSCSSTIVLCMSQARGHPLICFPKSTDLQPAARSQSPETVSLVRASRYYEISTSLHSRETWKWDPQWQNTACRRQCETGVRNAVMPADTFHILSLIVQAIKLPSIIQY